MKQFRPWAVALALASTLAGCGGGGSSDPATPPVAVDHFVSGLVRDAAGQPVAGVRVALGTATADSDSAGNYTLTVPTTVPAVVTFTKTGYAAQARPMPATLPSNTLRMDAAMLPLSATVSFNPAVASTLLVAGSTARVSLPAGALVRSGGGAPSANAQAQLTVIDASVNADTMPGNFGVQGGATIESFGALQVTLLDADGVKLNLATGQTASIRIPAVSRGGTPLPLTIPLYYLDEATGLWVQQGTASLQGSAPNQYYEGSVGHFSTWNCDRPMETVFINGCVEQSPGVRAVGGPIVQSTGVDYVGRNGTTADANGNFRIAVKKNATSRLHAQDFGVPKHYSGTVDVLVGATDVTLSSCLVLAFDGMGPPVLITPVPPGPTAPGDFAGNYSGTFTGQEAGTWSVTINSSGTVSGMGHSTTSSIDFSISGSVAAGGGVSLSAAAGTAGAAVYSGSISGISGAVAGTWRFVSTPLGTTDGNFTGTRN